MDAEYSTKALLTQAVDQYSKIEEPALLIYREGERDAVRITDDDMRELVTSNSITPSIVQFYIMYLQKDLPTDIKDRFYFFSPQFFGKLLEARNVSHASEYEEVRQWTEKAKLFERGYIFVPVYVDSRWSVIIICDLSSVTISSPDERKGSPSMFHLDTSKGRKFYRGYENYIWRFILQAWTERYRDQVHALSDMKLIEVEVPQKGNRESGVYMLHCIELIISDLTSPKSTFGSSRWEPIFTRWDSSEVLDKCSHIKDLILEFCGMNQLQLELRIYRPEIMSAIEKIGDSHGKDPTTEHAVENVSDEEGHGEESVMPAVAPTLSAPDLALSKKDFVHSRIWSQEETYVLLSCIAEGIRFQKGSGTHWDLISHEIRQKVGTRRSRDQVRRRYETLYKAFRTATDYFKEIGKGSSEITDDDLRQVKMATTLTLEWYNILNRHVSCKKRGVGRVTRGELTPQDVRSETVDKGFLALLTEVPADWDEERIDAPVSPAHIASDAPPVGLDVMSAYAVTARPETGRRPSKGIYRRHAKNKYGEVFFGKYEPRFKPPREKLDSGETLKLNFLPLGAYDTEEEARVVWQIAAFYYGKGEGRVELGYGRSFTVPRMERELCGVEKAKWVANKVREVFEDYSLRKREFLAETSAFSEISGTESRIREHSSVSLARDSAGAEYLGAYSISDALGLLRPPGSPSPPGIPLSPEPPHSLEEEFLQSLL